MKRIFLIFLILANKFHFPYCQNLIPNSSFEELRGQPLKLLPINNFEFERKSGNKAFSNNLNYWFSANKTTPDLRILSTDYYNKCKSEYEYCDLARTGINAVGIVESPTISNSGYDFMLWEDNPTYFTNSPEYVYQLGENKWRISCGEIELTSNHFIQIKELYAESPITIPYFYKVYDKSYKDIYLPKGNWLIQVLNNKGEVLCFDKIKI